MLRHLLVLLNSVSTASIYSARKSGKILPKSNQHQKVGEETLTCLLRPQNADAADTPREVYLQHLRASDFEFCTASSGICPHKANFATPPVPASQVQAADAGALNSQSVSTFPCRPALLPSEVDAGAADTELSTAYSIIERC